MLLNPLCYTAKFIAIHWILPNSFKNVKEACIPQGDFRHFIAVTLAVNIIIRSTGALYGM